MRLRVVTLGLITCLALADLAAATWLWVLWQAPAQAARGHNPAPVPPEQGHGPLDKAVAALALDQTRGAVPGGTRTAAEPASRSGEVDGACLLAVQAQMSASRQRSACP